MLEINRGSVENVLVSFEDILEGVTDVMPFNPKYAYGIEFTDIDPYTSGNPCAPGPTPMSVFCLVDAGADSGHDPGRYELFVRLDNPPEFPKVGPVRFKIQ